MTILAMSALLSSCFTPIYRYSYVRDTSIKPAIKDYRMAEVKIQNAELLLLDSGVISNSLVNLTAMVMENNALTRSSNAQLSMKIHVLVEDNDIINNRQSLSLIYMFENKDQEFARFILSSTSKELLLNKSLLVKELNQIIKTVRTKIK